MEWDAIAGSRAGGMPPPPPEACCTVLGDDLDEAPRAWREHADVLLFTGYRGPRNLRWAEPGTLCYLLGDVRVAQKLLRALSQGADWSEEDHPPPVVPRTVPHLPVR